MSFENRGLAVKCLGRPLIFSQLSRGKRGKEGSILAVATLLFIVLANHTASLAGQNSVSGSLKGFVRDIADGAPILKSGMAPVRMIRPQIYCQLTCDTTLPATKKAKLRFLRGQKASYDLIS